MGFRGCASRKRTDFSPTTTTHFTACSGYRRTCITGALSRRSGWLRTRGHAIQHARSYAPLKFRSILVKPASVGSNLGVLLATIGLFLNLAQLTMIGIDAVLGRRRVHVGSPRKLLDAQSLLLANRGDTSTLTMRAFEPLAHDLANALFVLGTALEGLQGRGAGIEVDTCAWAVNHAGSVLNRLRSLCRSDGVGAPQRVQVCALLDPMRDLLRAVCGGEVRLTFEVEPELPPVRVHRHAIERSLLNLVLNAAEAMRRQGQIDVRARSEDRDGRSWVLITVDDDGPGLPENALREVFQPGFTSRQGPARGIGLTSVVQALGSVGGHASSRLSPLGGVCFELALPALAR